MKEIVRKAKAKVNLRLKFEGRRDDGFHLLSMLNATISLSDEIIVTKKSHPGVSFFVEGSRSGDCPEADNTCIRAAKLFAETIQSNEGVSILLVKNIPSQAGLGGGSSDAAATLSALQELYQTDLNLMELAAKLGSDVPFFVKGGLQHVGGIGDELVPLHFKNLVGKKIKIIVPREKISTSLAYAAVRKSSILMEVDKVGRRFIGPEEPSYASILEAIDNDFLPVALELAPLLKSLFAKKSSLHTIGLTGSGSCCFVLPQVEGDDHFLTDMPSLNSEEFNFHDCVFE